MLSLLVHPSTVRLAVALVQYPHALTFRCSCQSSTKCRPCSTRVSPCADSTGLLELLLTRLLGYRTRPTNARARGRVAG